MGTSVEMVEVSPRDGLQIDPVILPTAAKIELISRLLTSGLRRIEVTSFVNPRKVPQMADAEQVLAGLKRPPGVHFTGLVLNRRGYERAAAAGCSEIGMVVVASDTFSIRNQGVTTAPTLGSTFRNPSACSRRSASRTGVRLTLSASAISCSVIRIAAG